VLFKLILILQSDTKSIVQAHTVCTLKSFQSPTKRVERGGVTCISAFHHVPLFLDGIWLILVLVETKVDLQLLQTRFVVIQLLTQTRYFVNLSK